MKKRFIIYLAVVVGIYVFAILIAGGRLIMFWDFPTLLLTPVVPLILMLGHYSPSEIIDSFRIAGESANSDVEIKKSLLFFKTIHRLIMLSGSFAVILGIVMILTTYPSENFSKDVGNYMAVCILSGAYAIFFVMIICVPFESALEKKMIR